MMRLGSRNFAFPLVLFILGLGASSCNQQRSLPADAPGSGAQSAARPPQASPTEPAAEPAVSSARATADDGHQDHDPRHGGTFFMALDGIHHLEGILVPPATFRVYVYDTHTSPISGGELQKAEGKVLWGDSPDAPEIVLRPASDGECLEAELGEPARFPVTLTLLLRFPGAPPQSRPELFTFPFSHYSHANSESSDHLHY
ncbi:MAG: hypothetical protein HY649_11290 [Acidobacteria bacterium]|nr:hypothetical protein [Acidobacteriota bacterium]